MKFYWLAILLLVVLLSHCTTDSNKKQKIESEQALSAVVSCNVTIIKAMQGKLATARLQELEDFLGAYSPDCPIKEEPLLHAILIQSFDERLPIMLQLLAMEEELTKNYILELLSLPATQFLPQRAILTALQEREGASPTDQEVKAALQKSIEQGNAQLRKLMEDKSHTYQ